MLEAAIAEFNKTGNIKPVIDALKQCDKKCIETVQRLPQNILNSLNNRKRLPQNALYILSFCPHAADYPELARKIVRQWIYDHMNPVFRPSISWNKRNFIVKKDVFFSLSPEELEVFISFKPWERGIYFDKEILSHKKTLLICLTRPSLSEVLENPQAWR